jgi:NADPH-dependent curcumin reductase CurA
MQNLLNRQILLRNRPKGEPKVADFELVEAPRPAPGEGIGLENAPQALIGLLRGRNFGNLLVRVGNDPRVQSC